jgi:very-short-patch-repair endonuclease
MGITEKGVIVAVRIVVGENDLLTVNPELAEQLHPTKNGSLTAQQLTANSGKKVWWLGSCGHDWDAIVSSRSMGRDCPYCSGQRVWIGFNDLATVNPELAAQLHPTKNGGLTAQQLTANSQKKIWWLGACGHDWDATVSHRSTGCSCPYCPVGITERTFRGVFEKRSGYYFESDRIDLIRVSRQRNRAQIDMLNDILKLVIEYDGAWTHGENSKFNTTLKQRLTQDKETTEALVKLGYNVIRIREQDRKQKLPMVPIDPVYAANVYQITYKSFGKDKTDIEELVQRIIEEKADWFKLPRGLRLAA